MSTDHREAADPQDDSILEQTKRFFQIAIAYVRSSVTYTFSRQRLYTSIDEYEKDPIVRRRSVTDPIDIDNIARRRGNN